jgi:hypothetical protein
MKINEFLAWLFPEHQAPWTALLKITDVYQELESKDLTAVEWIELFNASLQRNWLRARDKERWEMITKFTPPQQILIQTQLKQLRLFEEIKPKHRHYDCAFLMGTTAQDTQERLNNLIDWWKKGVRFDRLYIMSVYRELSQSEEQDAIELLLKKGLRLNEIEMMEFIMILLHAGKHPDQHILIVSSQPYVIYQSAVASEMLPETEIDCMGHSPSAEILPDIGLDTLARFVYASKERWKKNWDG